MVPEKHRLPLDSRCHLVTETGNPYGPDQAGQSNMKWSERPIHYVGDERLAAECFFPTIYGPW
jgi:hypothetical protein